MMSAAPRPAFSMRTTPGTWHVSMAYLSYALIWARERTGFTSPPDTTTAAATPASWVIDDQSAGHPQPLGSDRRPPREPHFRFAQKPRPTSKSCQSAPARPRNALTAASFAAHRPASAVRAIAAPRQDRLLARSENPRPHAVAVPFEHRADAVDRSYVDAESEDHGGMLALMVHRALPHPDATFEGDPHVANRGVEPAENRIADDRVADVDLGDGGNGRHLEHVVPGQPVPGGDLEPCAHWPAGPRGARGRAARAFAFPGRCSNSPV